jgi:hypothetical protein
MDDSFTRSEERPFETLPAAAPQDKQARLEARTTTLAPVAGDAAGGECAALVRDDLASFAARCFRELDPRTPFAENWHVELIAAKLAAVRKGQIRRLIVNLPPQCGRRRIYSNDARSYGLAART